MNPNKATQETESQALSQGYEVGLQSSAYNKEIRKNTIDKKEDYL